MRVHRETEKTLAGATVLYTPQIVRVDRFALGKVERKFWTRCPTFLTFFRAVWLKRVNDRVGEVRTIQQSRVGHTRVAIAKEMGMQKNDRIARDVLESSNA